MHSFSVGMVRRRISEAQRWQKIGMHATGMSFKAIGHQMGYHYTVVNLYIYYFVLRSLFKGSEEIKTQFV